MLSPKVLLRLEGLTVAGAALLAYRAYGASWKEFSLLILAPDVGMLGWAVGPRLGTALYNLLHTYTAVVVVWLLGLAYQWTAITPICLIWLTHIGADRLLGFGLKYPSGFKDTHLQRV